MSLIVRHQDRMQRYTVSPSGCWEWSGSRSKEGYGLLHARGCRLAHRYFWIELRGVIPAGLTIDHTCRNRCCVNPDHLELVTLWENVLRGNTLARSNASKTHCSKGHAFSRSNTAKTAKGRGRICITCRNEAQRRWYAAHPGVGAARSKAVRIRRKAEANTNEGSIEGSDAGNFATDAT